MRKYESKQRQNRPLRSFGKQRVLTRSIMYRSRLKVRSHQARQRQSDGVSTSKYTYKSPCTPKALSLSVERQILGVKIKTLFIHMWHAHCKQPDDQETRTSGLKYVLIYRSMNTDRIAFDVHRALQIIPQRQHMHLDMPMPVLCRCHAKSLFFKLLGSPIRLLTIRFVGTCLSFQNIMHTVKQC